MARQTPKWVRPDRQAYLVNLFHDSGGFCVYGERPCQDPLRHHYIFYIDKVIRNWVLDGIAEREALWIVEQKAIHSLAEVGRPRGQFSMVARDIFHARQPHWYLEGIGFSPLTFAPFAKVRIASSLRCLHVDLGDSLNQLSKSKRRKVIRYGKPLPKALQEDVDELCNRAVRHYLR